MEIPKYTKINNLHKCKELLMDKVIVTEKLHGTNIRFGKVDGKLFIGSRKQIMYDSDNGYNPDYDSYKFYNWFENKGWFDVDWPEGYVFYGEFVGSNIQKGVDYLPDNERDFVLFDIKDVKNDYYLNFYDLHNGFDVYHNYGILTVPIIAQGELSINDLDNIVNEKSYFAYHNGKSSLMEGIVIRPEIESRDKRGDRLIAKYKNEKFVEKKKQKKPKNQNHYYFNLGQEYSTYGRFVNTVDKLKQQINEDLDMKHIPDLMKIINKDVEEDAEFIPEDKKERKEFFKGVQSNVPHFLRNYLVS